MYMCVCVCMCAHAHVGMYRIRQNIRGGKLSRFINNMHYVGKLSRFADLSSERASGMWILECGQIRIN